MCRFYTLLFLLCSTLLSYSAGEITLLNGMATIYRGGEQIPAYEGIALRCQDVIKGDENDTYAEFIFRQKEYTLEGDEDWELSCADIGGRAVYVDGRAFILRGDKKLPLDKGDVLLIGDHVSTDEGSRLKIELENKKLLSLGPKSRVEIGRIAPKEPTIVDMVQEAIDGFVGWLGSLLKGESFEVDSPAHALGSRG